jgi:hypothetical protein
MRAAAGVITLLLCVMIIATDQPVPATIPARAVAATQPTGPHPRAAIITDAAPCLGYERSQYHRVAVYISLNAHADRTVGYEWRGINSGVNDLASNLGRGYRLVPLRRDARSDWFAVWSRGPGDPITDSRLRAVYIGNVSELVNVTASSLGVRCDGSRAKATAMKRRAVRQ